MTNSVKVSCTDSGKLCNKYGQILYVFHEVPGNFRHFAKCLSESGIL